MPRLQNAEDLSAYRASLKRSRKSASPGEIVITIGMGTCGLAAGAGETMQAIERELQKREIKATIRSVGCIGMCVKEPLVDIQLADGPRVTYMNIQSKHVPRLVEEHILKGQAVKDWAIGFVPPEW
jgi:(2Fe-2S) ferredoxin